MTNLDFIPPPYHVAATHRRSSRTQMMWAAGMLSVMCMWMWVHHVELARACAHLDALHVEHDQLDARRRFFDELVAERIRLHACEELQTAVDDPSSWLVVLAEISRLLPDGAMLTQLTIENDLPAPQPDRAPPGPTSLAQMTNQSAQPGASPAHPVESPTAHWPHMRLLGAAPSNVLVSTFTARLGGSRLFRNVETGLVKDAVVAGKRVRQFEVEFMVVPEIGTRH